MSIKNWELIPISKTYKIVVLLVIITWVCCYFPVAAYPISQTEIDRQEYLQIKQGKSSGVSAENVTEDTEIGTKNVSGYYNIPLSEEIQDYLFELCEKYDLSVPLVIALIDLETGGTFDNNLRHKNTNGTVDWGLCQLNSSNHKWFSELINEPDFDAGNIYHNLHAGIKFLSYLKAGLKDKYSGEELKIRFLNQYNMGVTGYNRHIKKTGKISRAYSDRILEKRDKYKIEKENF